MSAASRDPRKWFALASLSLAVLLVSVDNTILAVAIPSLAESLSPTPTELLWIGDIYSFVLAGLLITMGGLGDRVGRKRLLMTGLIAFAAVSVLAAFSQTAHQLIVTRALLGVAGATLMPSTLSLLRTTFPDAGERTFAVSVWGAVAAAGGGLGPLLGGVLLEHFWWGAVFLVNVPIVVIIISIGAWALRESKDPKPGRIDALSVVLSLVGILAFIAGVKQIALGGPADVVAWVYLIGGAAVLFWFTRRQLSLETPLIDVRLFEKPAFSGAVLSDLVSVFSLTGVYFFLSMQFQLADGFSPLQSGLALLPAELAALCGALLLAKAVARGGSRLAIGGGIALGAVGMLVVGLVHVSSGILLLAAMMMIGFGFGMSMTGTSDAILAAAPPARAGAASAVSETAYEFGAALGIAVLGTILGACYRALVDIPEGLPTRAASATEDSLSAAFEAAQGLPPAVAEQMLEAAREAFTTSLAITCLVAAVVAAIGAAIAFRVLPPRGHETDPVPP